jgi:hypothetical protein
MSSNWIQHEGSKHKTQAQLVLEKAKAIEEEKIKTGAYKSETSYDDLGKVSIRLKKINVNSKG